MKKIFITIAVIISLCSCNTNKEYCSACDAELASIYSNLYITYGLKHLAYQKLMSNQLDMDEFYDWDIQYNKLNAKIESLEKDKKYYELEIKKYSKKWKFSKSTQFMYNKLDSIERVIYGRPLPKLH